MLPCGTPQVMGDDSEYVSFTCTNWFLPERYDLNQSTKHTPITRSLSIDCIKGLLKIQQNHTSVQAFRSLIPYEICKISQTSLYAENPTEVHIVSCFSQNNHPVEHSFFQNFRTNRKNTNRSTVTNVKSFILLKQGNNSCIFQWTWYNTSLDRKTDNEWLALSKLKLHL